MAYTDCASDVIEVRWLNSAKKTVVLTFNKIRLKALYSVSSIRLCILE